MILWRVAALDAGVASVRYRALLPAINLAKLGYESGVGAGGEPLPARELDAVVFAKAFGAADLKCAREARTRGVPVILDLCDNIFVPGYAADRECFMAMAGIATAIVVTTEPLRAEVATRVPPHARLAVIPDGIESSADQREAALRLAELRAWRVDDVGRRARAAWVRGALGASVIAAVELVGVAVVGAIRNLEARRSSTLGSAAAVSRRKAWLRARWLRSLASALRNKLHTGGWIETWRAVLRYTGKRLPLAERRAVSRATAPPPAVARTQRLDGPVRRLCWFGNWGAPYARFGLFDLADIGDALRAVASRHRIRLVVVSNSRRHFRQLVAPLGIDCEYHEWAEGITEGLLASADVALLPNSLDAFSRCKSANRALFALAHGVPVVATCTQALEPLAGCIATGDWVAGIEQYLDEPEIARAHVAAARVVIAREFSGEVIAEKWRLLLDDIAAVGHEGASGGANVAKTLPPTDAAVGADAPAGVLKT
jgi:glycosyltransferase involved in cell wall biosynthesis